MTGGGLFFPAKKTRTRLPNLELAIRASKLNKKIITKFCLDGGKISTDLAIIGRQSGFDG
jgi:hypothetical protein